MADFPTPILTVDVVLLELKQDALWLGALERKEEPFQGQQALPGGYVRPDEDVDTEATARRVIREKAGLSSVVCEQLATFSDPKRDPRGWSATVVYYALIRGEQPIESPLVWLPVDSPGKLAFDHNRIVEVALNRLRNKGSWSNLPAFLLPPTFTYSDLRKVYELVLKTSLNDSAFRRKIEEMDLIEPVIGQKSKQTARPAQLFKLKSDAVLSFDRRI